MQPNGKLQRQIEKLENKLAFLNKATSYDLTPDQKDWIKNQHSNFIKLVETLKTLDATNEYVASFSEDLYDNLRKAKKKVTSWRKMKLTDVEAFKTVRKEKGDGWIPMVDIIPAPSRLAEIKDADLWDVSFPCMSYTNEELCQLTERIFSEQKILNEFSIGADKLSKIVHKICDNYNVPAYHNFSHGFNVFQMFYAVMKKTELGTVLDKTEIFASLLASLGHDLDHRGYNNQYEIKLKTKTSIAYFDNAVLENLHASTLIGILKDPEIGFFDCITDPNKKLQFRDLATSVILATDMSKHNKLLQKFTESVKATTEFRQLKAANQPVDKLVEGKVFMMERAQDKKRILKNIVHACDIGNPGQKYESYIYWAALISHEFDYQTKKEEKRGVDVTTFMKYKDAPSFYGGQVFFTKNLVLPLWEQIAILFEGAKEVVDNLQTNLQRLEEDKQKATQG